MRRTVKRKKKWPPSGSMRITSGFLWFRVTAGNRATGQLERRWLERATYISRVAHWENAYTKIRVKWTLDPVEWIDSDEQLEEYLDRYERKLELFRRWEEE